MKQRLKFFLDMMTLGHVSCCGEKKIGDRILNHKESNMEKTIFFFCRIRQFIVNSDLGIK